MNYLGGQVTCSNDDQMHSANIYSEQQKQRIRQISRITKEEETLLPIICTCSKYATSSPLDLFFSPLLLMLPNSICFPGHKAMDQNKVSRPSKQRQFMQDYGNDPARKQTYSSILEHQNAILNANYGYC